MGVDQLEDKARFPHSRFPDNGGDLAPAPPGLLKGTVELLDLGVPALGFKNTRKPDPKVELLSSTQPSIPPDGERPADGNSYASRGPFARYCVGNIKCSYGVPGNMTYG
jgi:hypothetical protein